MAFAIPLAMAATLIGGGIAAYGKYQAGMAAGAMDAAEARTASQLAGAERQAANVTEYSGFRAAEGAGLRAGAGISRQAVEYSAGNIAGGSPRQVRASQLALGQLGERETLAKYQETAYGERLRGAEYEETAALKTAAAGQERVAGTIGAIGTGVSTIASVAGEAASPVAQKWYQDLSSSPYQA